MNTDITIATVWLLWCTSLVLIARIGLGLIHVGLARPRHSIAMSIQHLAVICISGFMYWFCGFTLMFGPHSNDWYGYGLFMINTDLIKTERGPQYGAFFLLQLMMATFPASILIGAAGERLKLRATIILTIWISAILYPIFGHWIRSGYLDVGTGWLYQQKFFDFAGAAGIHILGGWAALAVLLVIKPRIGYESHNPSRFLENIHHAMPLSFLGVFLFALGLLGMAGLQFDGKEPAPTAAATTIRNIILALSTGGMFPILLIGVWQKKIPASLVIKSTMGALVAVLSGATVIGPFGAIFIAFWGSIAAMLIDKLLLIFGVDDNTGSVAIHLGGGIAGSLACSFVIAHSTNVSNPLGTAHLELGVQYFQNQFKGIVVCFFLCFPTTWLLARTLRMTSLLRHDKESELGGLDRLIYQQKLPSDELIDQITTHEENPTQDFELDIEHGSQIGAVAQSVNQFIKGERSRIQDFQLMLNQSQEGMLSVDLENYKILWCNPAAIELFETEVSVILQERLQKFFSHTNDDSRPLLPRQGVQSWTLTCPNGNEVEVDVIANEVETSQGMRMHVFFQDATERRDVQAMLELAKQAAEEASKSKSEFLANISHEIRTPMNGIIGMTEMALSTNLTQEQQEYLHTVKESSDHLLSLMNDVLDYAKIEAGKIEIESVPYAPIDITRKTIKSLSVKADKKKIDLNVIIDPDVPLTVIGDPTRFRQVLINLVDNAIKFTQDGSVTVILSTKPLTQFAVYLHLSVIDTGVGIPEETQNRIFSAFEQADSSITRKHGGTGLGLSICNRLVELMNGKIWLESTMGEGTTFYVDIRVGLPLNDDTGEFEAITDDDIGKKPEDQQVVEIPVKSYDIKMANDHESKRIEKSGIRILVVDDKAINRKVMDRMLLETDYQVFFADSGQAAVSLCEKQMFDLIFMDLQMPGMDGFEATKKIHEMDYEQARTKTPIIALTAHAGEDYRLACESAGMCDYLLKPVDRIKLLERIDAFDIDNPAMVTQDTQMYVNIDALKNRLGDSFTDDDLILDLAELLLEDGQKIIGQMEMASKSEMLALLHTLKGMSANVGAEALSRQATQWHDKVSAYADDQPFELMQKAFPETREWQQLLEVSVQTLKEIHA